MSRSVFIKTFGCQMNEYDSDRMLSQLGNLGFSKANELSHADVILINTCSVREKAESKVLSLLGQLKSLKKKNPEKVIGITGCVGSRMGRELLQRVPHLDLVMGPDQVEQVGEFVEEVVRFGKRISVTQFDQNKRSYSQPTFIGKARVSEFMTIMKGCDHYCTYCIVPFVRGSEKSRSMQEILEDLNKMVEQGTKEVTFLGQNINTYGKGTSETLSTLIYEANKIKNLKRIRYITSHPRDLKEDLISQFGTVEKLVPALHLPIQSGNNDILKKMGRLYTREMYLEKVRMLRHFCPDIALSTDMIVGFADESEIQFQDTLTVMEEVGFSQAFLFKYSIRPGTKAASFQEEELDEEIKDERLYRLQELTYSIMEKQNRNLIGTTQPVLVVSKDKKGRFLTGRTPHNRLVHIENAEDSDKGKIVDVLISDANRSYLKGTVRTLH